MAYAQWIGDDVTEMYLASIIKGTGSASVCVELQNKVVCNMQRDKIYKVTLN